LIRPIDSYPTLVAIYEGGHDVLTLHRLVNAECARLGVELLVNQDRTSASFGRPLAVREPRDSAAG
jgi:hypothetical protein